MNSIEPRRAIAFLTAFVALALLLPIESQAAASSKVTAAEARAEFERAKAAAAGSKDDVPQAKQAEAKKDEPSKPPRKRLFSRLRKKPEPAKEPSQPAEKVQESAPETKPEQTEKPERKSRFRLFGRSEKPKETAPPKPNKETVTAEAKVNAEESAPEEQEKPKRFSLFRRKKDAAPKDEMVEQKPEAKKLDPPPTEEVKPEALVKKKKRRPLFGGLFAKNRSEEQQAEKEEVPQEKKVESPAPVEKKKSGGSLFGIFRKSDSKEFAKAEKTKLGKSLETKPANASSRAGELGWYVVTESKVPFYAVGPGQPLPPEKILDRGSMLTVTKGGWGWSNVRLGSGELGVVSSKSVRAATVAEVARHNRPVATASKSRGSRRLFNILGRGPAPKPDLPTNSGDAPIRNFGLLPPVSSGD